MKDDLHSPNANTGLPKGLPVRGVAQVTTNLRVLATTDIHMQLLGYDYVQDRSLGHHGLASLATLIEDARVEAAEMEMACVLVDNGDILQGSALGDAVAKLPVTSAHPIVASLNALNYDVIGVGNHDLDHGLPYLHDIAAQTNAPVISSNLVLTSKMRLALDAIVPRFCMEASGTALLPLKIGFLSVLPEQTGVWNKPMLQGQARITPAKETLRAAIPHLRAQGAEIIVLLAHMGIEDILTQDDARALACLPGVDAMITGHTHRRLPGHDHAGLNGVDVERGTLDHCPAVMPGFNASDLAVLDLKLGLSESGNWSVLDHQTHLRSNSGDVPPHPKIAAICAPVHHLTRTMLADPVGHSDAPLHNFFSLAMPTPTCALEASAKRRIVQTGLEGTAHAKLPLLATSSAHTAGGRGGPDHFLHIAPGKIYRRCLAGLNPYANAICALHLTGAELRTWLEHTVGIYRQLQTNMPDQGLLRPDRPTFHFDTIYGLEYGVDPTVPAGKRITTLRFDGQDVADAQPFILATTKFRAAGGGGGAQFSANRMVFECSTAVSTALEDALKDPARHYTAATRPWYFDCAQSIQAVLQTSLHAKSYLHDIDHLAPEMLERDDQGFGQIRLTL